jgi:hypothetical protein
VKCQNLQIKYGKMEENACSRNKARISALETHVRTKSNSPEGLIIAIL